MIPRTIFTGFVTLAFSRFSVARSRGIQWVDCASNVPQPLQGTDLPTTLPSTLHCGRLDVAMDYSKPFSPENRITLGFSMYRPNKPQGLLNFNPGGPGAEAASYAWQFALNLTDAALFSGLEGFDFLAMDVRGSYSSNPLNCSIGDFVFPSSYPTTEAEFKASQAAINTYAQSCIDLSTPKGIVAHVGTAETVQDWDSLREALGYEKMHFLSYSYGTLGAAEYAKKFPQHVGRFVLDSIFLHASNLQLVTSQIKATNNLLLRADAYCMNDPTCPFHSEGKGSIIKAFTTVLERAKSGNSSNTTADGVRVVVALEYLSFNPDFQSLNQALYAALSGNWTALSYSSFGPTYTAACAPALPVMCLDGYLANNTFSSFSSIRRDIAKYDPAQFEYTQYLSMIVSCGGWPYHSNFSRTSPITIPMLFVTSDFDLNTPTELATMGWSQAPQSTLVVRHGDDHGTFIVPGPARTAEIDFLVTGNFPKATNQTLVTIYPLHSKRGPIADPYTVPIGPLAGDFPVTQ